MKAINKAFYKSAVRTQTTKYMTNMCFTPNARAIVVYTLRTIPFHSSSFSHLLSLSRPFFLSSFSSSFHPHDGHQRKLNHHFTHTHSLARSFFHSFSRKGSDCYYSYIQITYILMLLLLLLLCMTKIQSDSTHAQHMYTKQQASKYCDKGAIN